MEETTISAPPAKRYVPRAGMIAGIVVIFLILALAAAAFFVRVQGDRLGSRLIEAARLHDVLLVSATDIEPHLYALGVSGLKDARISGTEGTVVEFAKGGTTKAYIRDDSQSGTEGRVLVVANKTVGSAEPHEAALAVSASGKYVAYSVSASDVQRISDWTMRLYDVAQDRTLELGIGYGAQFVTHEGREFLIYTTPQGIQYMALDTSDGFLTPFDIADSTFYAVKVSPDGAYIATRDAATREWGLLEITKLEIGFPIRMTPLHTDLSMLTSVTFVGGRLIGIEPVWNDETRAAIGQERIRALPLSAAATASTTSIYTIPTTSLFVFNHL